MKIVAPVIVFPLLHFLLRAGPPSPPRNLMFNLNDTCLMLEWSPPSDTGGRRDLTYNVLCKRCGPEPNRCKLCEEDLRFLPRPLGLTNATVTVTDFSANANYTFEIESLNGVSDMSSSPRQVAIITVSTNQGGEYVFLLPDLIVTRQLLHFGFDTSDGILVDGIRADHNCRKRSLAFSPICRQSLVFGGPHMASRFYIVR